MNAPGPGDPAPDFTLRDQHGQDVTLSGLRGAPVVLLFYPFAFSRVCSGELRSLRDHPALGHGEVRVLAISCDPTYSLRAFSDAEGHVVPLLSDFWPHGAVAASYGVLDEDRGCARRSTFVLDGEGTVRWSVHNPMPEARDLEELDAVLRDLTGPGQ